MMTSGAVEGAGEGLRGRRAKEERIPQWTEEETRDLIAIRGELEKDFNLSKRNKKLWEAVAGRMREKGFFRTPDQCKAKWKNLISRYKGQETSEAGGLARQAPFSEELHALFTEHAKSIQHGHTEAESGPSHSKKKIKTLSEDKSSEEVSNDEDDAGQDSDQEQVTKSGKRKFEKGHGQKQKKQHLLGNPSSVITGIHDLLKDFFQQQQRMEAQWLEMMERRARERLRCELEWRQSMEKLERERLALERAWWEREEQRRIKDETRAEKRDALLNTLLSKLSQDDF